MNVTTPKTQQTGFEKRLHTPPTIEREKGRTTPTKFLKGLSNNLFKRTPSFNKGQTPKFGDDQRPPSNFSKVPKMSKRYKTPKPLNLNQPLSPPKSVKKYEGLTRSTSTVGSFQSVDNMSLASPVALQGSLYEKKPKNLARMLHEALDSPRIEGRDSLYLSLNQSRQSYHSSGNLEEINSPCSNNISLMSSRNAKCFRKYIGERCCICDEDIYNSFTGEKVIELSCSHISHYNCYLALYECTYTDNKFPMCNVCNTEASPQDQNVINLLVSTVLSQTKTATGNNNSLVEPNLLLQNTHRASSQGQFLELKSAKIMDPTFMSYTPIEQIIKTADISCNGYKDFQDESEDKTLNDIRLSICDTLESETLSLFHSEPSLTSPGLLSPEKDSPIVTLFNDEDSRMVSLEVKFPQKDATTKNLGNILQEEVKSDAIDDIHQQLGIYFKDMLSISVMEEGLKLDKLKLFDIASFSTDEKNWSMNILIICFDNVLILYDYNFHKIIGKIPIDEISHVATLDSNVLIIDTKSITSPEIFLRFNDDMKLLKKWKYYMENPSYQPTNPLSHITDSAMFVLSDELCFKIHPFQRETQNRHMPWTEKEELPLRLILCIDICSIEHEDENTYYKDKLQRTIRKIISNLTDRDLLGLVTIGSPEKRNISFHSGTYIGMIDKSWGEWDNIIANLEVNHSKEVMFSSKEEEIQTMLQTCYRLVCTLPENEKTMFQNRILYLNQFDNMEINLDDMVINRKVYDIIFNKHMFGLSQYSLVEKYGRDDVDIDNLVYELRHLKYYNLAVTINDAKIFLGHVNGSKKISLKEIILKRHLIPGEDQFCKIEWDREDSNEHICKIVPVMIKR